MQIKKTGIFKSELLLNNRLINVIYKIAEFKSSHNNALKLFNEYLSILTLKNCQCILRSYGYYIDKEREMIGFLYEYLDDNLEHYIYLKSIDLENASYQAEGLRMLEEYRPEIFSYNENNEPVKVNIADPVQPSKYEDLLK